MVKEKFEALMGDVICALPQDVKAFLRIFEDPDLEDEQRLWTAGALLHLLSGQNAIPGMRGVLAYVDDVIVLRLVLERLEAAAPEVMARHLAESPELLEPLGEDLAIVRDYLGELTAVLERACDQLGQLTHQGRSARDCATDPEAATWLYDAVQEALLDQLDFDEDDVIREVRGVSRVKTSLQQRVGA